MWGAGADLGPAAEQPGAPPSGGTLHLHFRPCPCPRGQRALHRGGALVHRDRPPSPRRRRFRSSRWRPGDSGRPPGRATGRPPRTGAGGNDTARSLSARYGDGWSFEIVGYHLGGEEVEVTGQLRANGSSVQRTARGNGRDLGLGERLKRASDACLRDCAAALRARP